MDEIEVKRAIESWVASNKDKIRDFKMEEDRNEIRYCIFPKSQESSDIYLTVNNKNKFCDFDVGVNTQFVDYKVSSIEEIIEILEAVKSGKLEETIIKVFNIIAETHGTIELQKKTLDDTGLTMGFHLLAKFFKTTKQVVRYHPW